MTTNGNSPFGLKSSRSGRKSKRLNQIGVVEGGMEDDIEKTD